MATDPRQPERLSEASARTFTPRVIRWIVGAGIVSLLATLLLSVLMSGKEPTEATAEANTYSYSAVGHRAFVALLERLGIDVTVSRYRSAEKASPTRPLLVIEPDSSYAMADHIERLSQVVHGNDAPLLMALPKWRVAERDLERRWANRIELVSPYDAGEPVTFLMRGMRGSSDHDDWDDGSSIGVTRLPAEGLTVLRDGEPTPWRVSLAEGQFLDPHDQLEPLMTVVVDGEPRTLVAQISGTRLYLVSDPDILNTMGIGSADHAPLAVSLVTGLLRADEVVVDEIDHGFEKAETIWQELFGFPLILVTLHLAGLLALALWAAMARFGKPETRPPRVPSGKQTLLDNTATLLALGHHAGYGAKRYLETTLRSLSHTYGIPPESSEAARVEQLATIASRRGHKLDLRNLVREIGALADRGGTREEHRARELARKVYSFRKELSDGHRNDR